MRILALLLILAICGCKSWWKEENQSIWPTAPEIIDKARDTFIDNQPKDTLSWILAIAGLIIMVGGFAIGCYFYWRRLKSGGERDNDLDNLGKFCDYVAGKPNNNHVEKGETVQ